VKNVTLCFHLPLVIASDLDTSLYFIITNFHTVLKLQVKVSHDMNSLTINTMLD